MGLESATYVSGLVSTNPISSDKRSQGDDHFRLIKGALKSTFPNAERPLRFNESVATQTADYTVNESTSDGKIIPINARAAARLVTLPLTPSFDGLRLTVVKADHSLNPVTISGNGNLINGESDLVLHQRYQKVHLIWCDEPGEWFAELEQIPTVGSWLWHSGTTAPRGYVIASEKTIGNSISAAPARANEDCLALYQHLWNTYSDSICPVTGGRGASALADFDAGKPIRLLDVRGRTLFNLDTAGGTAATRLTNALSSIDGTAIGSSGGTQNMVLSQAQLPSVNLSVANISAATALNASGTVAQRVSAFFNVGGAASTRLIDGDGAAVTFNPITTLSGYVPLGGSGANIIKMPPTMVQLLCLKL